MNQSSWVNHLVLVTSLPQRTYPLRRHHPPVELSNDHDPRVTFKNCLVFVGVVTIEDTPLSGALSDDLQIYPAHKPDLYVQQFSVSTQMQLLEPSCASTLDTHVCTYQAPPPSYHHRSQARQSGHSDFIICMIVIRSMRVEGFRIPIISVNFFCSEGA